MHIEYERLVSPVFMNEAMRVTRHGLPRTVLSGEECMPKLSMWKKMLEARHSPIRSVVYRFRVYDVPYWVHAHLVRHCAGVQMYVQSQRGEEDRDNRKQGALVDMIIDANAEAILTLGDKRLCRRAADETRRVVHTMRSALLGGDSFDRALSRKMGPQCKRLMHCPEAGTCGMCKEGFNGQLGRRVDFSRQL